MDGSIHDTPVIGSEQTPRIACRIVGKPLERRQTEFRRIRKAAVRFGGVLPCLQIDKGVVMSLLLAFAVMGTVLFASGASTGGESIASGKDSAPMVVISAGLFPMGVPPGDRDGGRDEYPRHEVFLDSYAIDTFEVTNGRYLEFVKATGHRVPQNPKNPTRNLWQGEAIPESLADRPVVNVDWFDAAAYCAWAGKRLPTEAEWEKAAKGNHDWRFPWGNVEPTAKHLNYNQQWIGEKTLMPVGSYEAGKSPYGVYDMAGNVWEWVSDWYDPRYYEKSPKRNPKGPETGTRRVLRGSGWQNETPTVRIFTRVESDPSIRNESTGFRCARDAK
jgi:formylglycine-generating enzyme required for sulfatase activity